MLLENEDYVFSVDNRGKIASLFAKELLLHPRKYKHFSLKLVNNQPQDMICYRVRDNKVHSIWEYKLEDLAPSLKNNLLRKELMSTYTMFASANDCDKIYLICGGTYESYIYAWLNSIMNSQFPYVRYYTPMTAQKAIEKTFELIRKPPTISGREIPILVRTKSKGYSLSLSALMDGISNDLGFYLVEKGISVNSTELEINKWVNEFYEDNSADFGELPFKIYQTLQNTYGGN